MTVFAGDEDLLRRFRAGDRQALSTVYWHYVDAVELFLRRCLAGAQRRGWRPDAELADIMQDVFVKAFSERARIAYDPAREYRPFLLTIARNVLVDRLRTSAREVRLDGAAVEALADGLGAAADPPAPWADPQAMLVVEGYVAALSDSERAVYRERYERCRSQEHTAHALGITRQRVRTLENKLRTGLSRALARAQLARTVSGGAPSCVPPAAEESGATLAKRSGP